MSSAPLLSAVVPPPSDPKEFQAHKERVLAAQSALDDDLELKALNEWKLKNSVSGTRIPADDAGEWAAGVLEGILDGSSDE